MFWGCCCVGIALDLAGRKQSDVVDCDALMMEEKEATSGMH